MPPRCLNPIEHTQLCNVYVMHCKIHVQPEAPVSMYQSLIKFANTQDANLKKKNCLIKTKIRNICRRLYISNLNKVLSVSE